MQYRVLWAPYAEDKFELLLQAASDGAILAATARRLDRNLTVDPEAFGESRYNAMRVGFEYP